MRSQIIDSIKFDCSTSHLAPIVELSGEEWLVQRREKLNWNIEYHANHQAEEIERTASRNEWIRLLRESLEVQA
ncbi:hypothetical protein D3C76_1051280 [compost metagenome]